MNCLPMASKPIFAAVFALLVHVFTSLNHAVRHLEHPRVKIYTFYTAIKEGFATGSFFNSEPYGLPERS